MVLNYNLLELGKLYVSYYDILLGHLDSHQCRCSDLLSPFQDLEIVLVNVRVVIFVLALKDVLTLKDLLTVAN